jgi:ADP-ribosylglycohydrolase
MSHFIEKLKGALYGHAIGDGMGGPVEGWSPERIATRFGHLVPAGDVRAFLPVTHDGDPSTGKGAGRVTDDTLMAEALIRAYSAHQDHLDAYDYETFFLPEIAERKVWVPERQAEMTVIERPLFWPERYPWIRLTVNHAEPRSAGTGNCVNCGVAMYTWPIGAVNAGDPETAYEEAAAFGLAHNESFAVEAGAVMAGACAAAFGANGSLEDTLDAALALARDGTKAAIRDVLLAVDPQDAIERFISKTRAAIAPYDQRTSYSTDDAPLRVSGINDVGRPSRTHAIEELPIALGALQYGEGDFLRTIDAGTFYGRDCDSIAGMAGALYGALFGVGAIPADLRAASDAANRRDWDQTASGFAATIAAILDRDRERFARRQRALGSST